MRSFERSYHTTPHRHCSTRHVVPCTPDRNYFFRAVSELLGISSSEGQWWYIVVVHTIVVTASPLLPHNVCVGYHRILSELALPLKNGL